MVLDIGMVRWVKKTVRKGIHMLDVTCSRVNDFRSFKTVSHSSPPARALEWIRAQEIQSGGIRAHSGHADAYPEVTGYLVPTLLQYGERELATRLVRWLVCSQRGDGGFTDPDRGMPHIFDTGQVLRALLAGDGLVPGALDAARRAMQYLFTQMIEAGRGGFGARYSGSIPEGAHLYVLPPLLQATEVLQEPEYRVAVERCREYYLGRKDNLRLSSLTHFLGYELEALIDLGHADLAGPVLDMLREHQDFDGAVPGVPSASWVCAPGLAQLALCWYKIGQWEPADKAMAWLEKHQRPSGGFFGSYGSGASYFPNVELPWAIKFYLDAHRLRVLSSMERNAHILQSEVSATDGRAQAVIEAIRSGDRVIELGCGKGRFLKVVRQVYRNTECTGVDISPTLLAEVPSDIQRLDGSLESVPCPDNSFDVVFSVEAIEHSANLEAAVAEMIRIARRGGRVVIIEKQQSHWGRLKCLPWEEWPNAEYLKRLLNRGCDHVSYEPVSYDGRPADGLMVAWQGIKRSRLTGSEWNQKLISQDSQPTLVERVRRNHISPWGREVLLLTSPGERVLEIGSGTGEISLALALAGRQVSILDISPESLEFTQRCAQDLGVHIETFCHDAARPLPFKESAFDCVWSSGLLEHFTSKERRAMLREWSRITADRVITLVPNAASVAYRVGKEIQEAAGVWPYGLEMPILSLRDDFGEVGLRVLAEYSVGVIHALSFLPTDHALRRVLAAWIEGKSEEELRDYHQGYLLVTVGWKCAG